MGRIAKNRSAQYPKPVEKVELSEQYLGLRIVLLVILLIVAVGSFAYGIHTLLSAETGWTEIEADSSADTNVANEFVLMYELGSRENMSVTAEKKALVALYTEVMVDAYKLFHNNQEFESVNNIYYINRHPNEEIVVDDMIYQALELVQSFEDRTIYMAPILEQYDDIFYCETDAETVAFDPRANENVADVFHEMTVYANDNVAIDVKLLGDNKIKLYVSEEYLDFCKKNDITDFIDFTWMKNAFIVDYLAEILISQGYTAAAISSYDGFLRNLDDSETLMSFNLFDNNEEPLIAGIMEYSGSKSIVYMRNYPMYDVLDAYRYYTFESGEVRTLYLDTTDGLCKSATSSLYSYSEDMSCAEILLQIAPIYISEELDTDALNDLMNNQIYSAYIEDEVIYYNEKKLSLRDLYDSDVFTYTTSNIE